MYGLCPACGSELDDEGNCWVCGYMAHFGSPDDYDYDDFNDEYLPQELFYQVIIMLICPICGYPLDSDGRCWNCGYWMRTHPLDPFAPGSVYNGGSSDD